MESNNTECTSYYQWRMY